MTTTRSYPKVRNLLMASTAPGMTGMSRKCDVPKNSCTLRVDSASSPPHTFFLCEDTKGNGKRG